MRKSRTSTTQSKAKPPEAQSASKHQASSPRRHRLTAEREAELIAEAKVLGEELILFPGRFARRAAWFEKIHLAAERDAADLIRTPFSDDEPLITQQEIDGFLDKINLLRVAQSRWTAVQKSQKTATVDFDKNAAEAAQHKGTLLRFFALRFRKNPQGQKRLSDIRAGAGDSDLVQDVSDILTLCEEERDAVKKAPRGEWEAFEGLKKLAPVLSYLLAAKTLTPKAQEARKLRDAVYTLVLHSERRFRAGSEYWYGGTDQAKDYAPFPASSGTGGANDDEEQVTETEENDAAPGDEATSAEPEGG